MVAMLSARFAGPYRSDIPMHPRPMADTRGPWEPSEREIMSGRSFLGPRRRAALSSALLVRSRLPCLRRGARELREPAPMRRIFDEPAQPFEPGLFLPGADHPPTDRFPVRGGLSLKESPCVRVLLQHARVGLLKLIAALFVRIDAGPVFSPSLERLQPGGPHPPFAGERQGKLDVHGAPDAAGPARTEADRVAPFIHALPDAIDPAHAKGLVHRLRPGDARLARALLEVANPELLRRGVMLFKPLPQMRWRREERGVHRRLASDRSTSEPKSVGVLRLAANRITRIPSASSHGEKQRAPSKGGGGVKPGRASRPGGRTAGLREDRHDDSLAAVGGVGHVDLRRDARGVDAMPINQVLLDVLRALARERLLARARARIRVTDDREIGRA